MGGFSGAERLNLQEIRYGRIFVRQHDLRCLRGFSTNEVKKGATREGRWGTCEGSNAFYTLDGHRDRCEDEPGSVG